MENINELETVQNTNSAHERIFEVPSIAVTKKPFYTFVKRTADIIVSAIALCLCFIPMLIIAVIIKCDSPGPVIYKQERLGKNGKPFMLYKFRSMGVDAESCGAKWAEENDERCTRIGKILRSSRLDELPQLINILSGKMSLVGPRPERKCFYDEFEKYIHGFSNRMAVTPGLTGWAQVNGGYDLLPEEKIVYDMEYIQKRSIWLDIKCIFKTVAIVFNHKGAR